MDDNSLAKWEGVAESSGGRHLMHEAMRVSLPAKPPRSKLEPHHELIQELRRKGRTYREVARLIHQRLGLYVAPSTLHSFVKVRAKHRQRQRFELPPAETSLSSSPAVDPPAAWRLESSGPRLKTRFAFPENEPRRPITRESEQ
jgi:hypothetical protein